MQKVKRVSDFRIFHQAAELAALGQDLHLALGVFDGVHVGHQEVIRGVVDKANAEGGLSGVVTFFPHPIQLLAPAKAPKRILASIDHKAQILENLGVDFLLVLAFTKELAALEPEEFLDLILNDNQVKTISVGEDWLFGKARRGNAKLLSEFSKKRGFELVAVSPVMHKEDRISSTRIRQAIADGNIKAAAEMLGRAYTVFGKIVEGNKLGRTIGFPTANVVVQNEQLPPSGVWAVESKLDDEWLPAIANLGVRPTVDEEGANQLLEVHVFGFDEDVYGQIIETRFLKYVRPEQKFGSVDELNEQIQKDVKFVKEKVFRS